MGWKDTVIKNADIMDLDIPCETCESNPPLTECLECMALKHREAQAKITWDVAFKVGERKVVEAIEKLHLVRPEREDVWQKFLKSEGIE